MFGDSENQEPPGAGLPSGGSEGKAPARGGLWQNVLLFVGIVCLGVAAYQYLLRPPKLPVPEPADWSQLEPHARAYLQELVKQARANARDATSHAQMGLAYGANGLWALAATCFENTARLAPKEPLAPYYVAVSLAQSGDAEKAKTALAELRERFPDFPQGIHREAELALAAGDLDAAAAGYARLMELAPDEWQGHAGLGEVRLRQEQYPEAVSLLEQAVQKDPSAALAQHLLGQACQQVGRTNEAALRLLPQAPPRFPMPDPWGATLPGRMRLQRDLATVAQSFVARGQPDQAVNLLTEALRYDTNSVLLLNTLGLAHQQAGDPRAAWQDLQRVLEVDSNNVPALVTLSGVAISLGDLVTANETADRAVTLAPKLPQAFVAKANADLAGTNSVAAITALRQAVQLAPDSGGLHLNIANILLLNQGKPTEALAEYQEAVAREPRLIPAHVRIAQIRLSEKRTNEALAAIRTARRFAPTNKTLETFEQAILSPPPPPGPPANGKP